MNILLIRPPSPKKSISLSSIYFTEPFELELLYSVLSPVHNVKIIDFLIVKSPIEKIMEKLKNVDVVCFTGYAIHVNIIKNLAYKIKTISPKTYILVGGVHAEWCSLDFEFEYIDIIVKRFALQSFNTVISLIDKGKINEAKNFNFELPSKNDGCFKLIADRKSTSKWRNQYSYLLMKPAALIRTSYGCPYKCSFCIRWQLAGGNLIILPVDEVISEIKSISEENIFIIDDNFLMNPKRIEEFILKIKNSGIKRRFLSYARIDFILDNEELIQKLSEIGFIGFLIGVESHRPKDLEEYGKNITPDDAIKASEILKKYDIDSYASLIVKPDMTYDDFVDLRKYLSRSKFDFINIQPFIPFRNTKQYEKYKDRIFVKENDYPKWDFSHQVVYPEHMKPSSFYFELLKTYLIFYLSSSSQPLKKAKKYGFKIYFGSFFKGFSLLIKYIQLIWDTYLHYD